MRKAYIDIIELFNILHVRLVSLCYLRLLKGFRVKDSA